MSPKLLKAELEEKAKSLMELAKDPSEENMGMLSDIGDRLREISEEMMGEDDKPEKALLIANLRRKMSDE